MIKDSINELLSSKHLTLVDAREVFDEILTGLADDVLTSSFLTSLKLDEITDDELLACILSSKDAVTQPKISFQNKELMENISFNSKYKNLLPINFIQDIICSACGLPSYKYSYDIDNNSNFMLLKKMGANFDKKLDYNSDEFESLNFAYIKLSKEDKFYKYTKNNLSRLPFKTVFEVASIFLNPLNSKNMFLGVNSVSDVEYYANLALKLNYNNSVIVSSDNDFPYISTNSKTYLAEAWKNKIFTYVLTPELLEIKESPVEDLFIESIEQAIEDIENILSNKLKGPKYDFIVLNAGLSLYIAKMADSVMDGFGLARKTIDSSCASEKLNQILKFYK